MRNSDSVSRSWRSWLRAFREMRERKAGVACRRWGWLLPQDQLLSRTTFLPGMPWLKHRILGVQAIKARPHHPTPTSMSPEHSGPRSRRKSKHWPMLLKKTISKATMIVAHRRRLQDQDLELHTHSMAQTMLLETTNSSSARPEVYTSCLALSVNRIQRWPPCSSMLISNTWSLYRNSCTSPL